ncbi:immunoglobulin superfamily member 1-like [Mauremys mutica]|uniref:immunoglobulin superfamily member 1-like n=1 Tax=Mauremys mutica TaxID=74926 RepID=UPI001D15FA16|nr:immunoglobulin superfamily member 1-like [Mauremys mutica]
MAFALIVLFLGLEYPKPTIRVSPSRVVALGGSVTVRCEGWYLGMEFFLRKAGHPNPQVQTVPDGTVAEFPIPSVSWEDGGSYTCDYRSITQQSYWSYPSDPVEIIVGAMIVLCRGQRRGVRFVLNKEGHHFPPVDSVRFGAEFRIINVRQEDGGSYSCSYHSRSEPFAVSYPSDSAELVVRGSSSSCSSRPLVAEARYCRESGLVSGQRHCQVPCSTHFPAENWAPATLGLRCRRQRPAHPSLPRPSIALSPTGVTAPGADVTIRCQGQRRDVRFFLHKAGDRNPQRHMDPAGTPQLLRHLLPSGPPGRPDFTHANIARLVLGAAVLLVLGLILAEACYSRPRGAP